MMPQASEAALPEELLREILGYELRISTTDFHTFTSDPPRRLRPVKIAAKTSPEARLLRVSTRWLRVGTPLLYESVKLSTPSHLCTLHKLLLSNPDIGLYVRHLRLHRVYGAELYPIMQRMPNLHSLYLYPNMPSSGTNLGIIRALHTPPPRIQELYVNGSHWSWLTSPPENKKSVAIEDAIIAFIGECPTLRHLTFTPDFGGSVIDAIRASGSLRDISIFTRNTLLAFKVDAALKEVVAHPSVKSIRCLLSRMASEK